MCPHSLEHSLQPSVPSESPEQEFHRLQTELRLLARSFVDRRDIDEGVRQEVIGAAFEQPPYSRAMTEQENIVLCALLQRAREALDAAEGRTIH